MIADHKPHAPATERNREPIAELPARVFADRRRVLEIGSGTGQHAVYFAERLAHLRWQCSDRAEYLPGIGLWLAHAGLANTPPALLLDVNGAWPQCGLWSADHACRQAACQRITVIDPLRPSMPILSDLAMSGANPPLSVGSGAAQSTQHGSTGARPPRAGLPARISSGGVRS